MCLVLSLISGCYLCERYTYVLSQSTKNYSNRHNQSLSSNSSHRHTEQVNGIASEFYSWGPSKLKSELHLLQKKKSDLFFNCLTSVQLLIIFANIFDRQKNHHPVSIVQVLQIFPAMTRLISKGFWNFLGYQVKLMFFEKSTKI